MPLPAASRVVLATHNRGKIAEFTRLLQPLHWHCVTAADYALPEPAETGDSFAANAILKAEAALQATGLASLADDSGLMLDALAGAPGIHSARWAGEPRDYAAAMATIIGLLGNTPDRRAHFVTILALCTPDGITRCYEGRSSGVIVWPPRGTAGFGYDPIFQPDGATQTFAEMRADAKAQYSHRARACAALITAQHP
jgi:XTP/dITP diphosphohydrolase